MLVDTLPLNFKRVLNVICVILLIASSIVGCSIFASYGLAHGVGIILGICGLFLAPLATYLVLVLILGPTFLFFNVLLKADKKLDDK